MGTAQAIPTGFVLSDHGALAGLLDDDHTQYALLAGRAGGQTLIGGLNVGDELTLQGTSVGTEAGGRVDVNGVLRLLYTEGNTAPADQSAIVWEPTFTTAAGYLGQLIRNDASITYTNTFYIYASVLDRSVHTSNAAAGFQAFTLFNALCTIQNGTANDIVQMIILNDGGVHQRTTVGTSNAVQHITVGANPALHADVNGAVANWTVGACGMTFAPKWNCVFGGTIDMNDVYGMQMVEPAVALFQTNSGTRRVNNIAAINWPNMQGTTGYILDGEVAVIRSLQNAGVDRYFLRHLGNAQSTMRGQLNFDVDLTGISFGASTDLSMGWAGGGFLFWQFGAPFDQLRFSNPSSGRFLFDSSVADNEFNFNCNRFSLGAQTGAVGNQVGVFVAPTRTATIGGGWSDFLLTQGGNITVDAALSQLAGWTVNAPSITIGTGSVVDAVGLLVGGNANAGTNRYGLLVLSNPSGGTLNYCARFQGAAGVRVDGIFEHGTGNLGFYGTAPIAQPAAVGVDAASIHAALVSLGLIT